MESREQVEIRFPSKMLYVAPIRAFVTKLAQRLDFDSTRVEDIELAVDEVCNNAVEHGSKISDTCIYVSVSYDQQRLEILVQDSGVAGDTHWLSSGRLREVRDAMSPESERGHGIFLMESIADEVSFRANEMRGTDVHLVFLRPSLTDAEQPTQLNP